MKPFALYHTFKDHFVNGEQKLRQLLLEIVHPDAIFLLGATLDRRRTESIFSTSSPTAQHISGYFLLVLIPETMNKELYEWQDQIEQHLKTFTTVTVIVIETITFQQWLNNCHLFAVTVAETSAPLFKNDNIQLSLPCKVDVDQVKMQRCFTEGITKAKSFLAGAELYLVRKEYKLAAFMLHQTTEQALTALIKIGMGYHTHTHNIDRLLRYASMVSYQIQEIFPRTTDHEKQLFKVLQNAYSDARYSELYAVGYRELSLIIERVKEIVAIAESWAVP
jgi:HEPN domain-containing protein